MFTGGAQFSFLMQLCFYELRFLCDQPSNNEEEGFFFWFTEVNIQRKLSFKTQMLFDLSSTTSQAVPAVRARDGLHRGWA